MATIVNTPQPDNSGNGIGFMLGMLVLAILAIVLIYYGIPMLRNSMVTPSIKVPDKIDVNVNQGQ